jgi:transcriptional regulator with XRE-family HTH domain
MRQRLQVGSRIRSLRLDRNLTQERLAERAGVSRDSVIYAENGTKAVSIDILHLLGRALGVPVTSLFTEE